MLQLLLLKFISGKNVLQFSMIYILSKKKFAVSCVGSDSILNGQMSYTTEPTEDWETILENHLRSNWVGQIKLKTAAYSYYRQVCPSEVSVHRFDLSWLSELYMYRLRSGCVK